jgi:hypothetical protein
MLGRTLQRALHSHNAAVDGGALRHIQQLKFNSLLDSLNRRNPWPSHTWGSYLDFLAVSDTQDLSSELHREVLRKCVPPTQELKFSAARRMVKDNFPVTPHLYESRLQTVVRNIRVSGERPTVGDYNFVLDQFAAVGHHLGAVRVLQEMKRVEVEPNMRTYTLCLQSIARRLSLPARKTVVERLNMEASDLCLQILHEMWNRRLPLSSVTLDLAFRIFKETMDDEGLSWILKSAYGIDLAYPDRLPLEILTSLPKAKIDLDPLLSSKPDFFTSNMPALQPFSTSALNTTIDFLGRMGDVSRLVQAFEVLTNPLPPESPLYFSRSFDEDEDWGEGSSAPPEPPEPRRPLPSAEPNTTTYAFLIRYLSRAKHAVLTRHYLWENLILSEEADRRLRGDLLRGMSHSDIIAPRLSISHHSIMSMVHLANHDKNLPLLRQSLKVCHRARKRKGKNIQFYERLSDGIVEEGKVKMEPENPRTEQGQSVTREASFSTNAPHLPKTFNLTLHLRILHAEHSHLSDLEEHIEFLIARTTQRIKERLGRRVWKGKDIWLPRVSAPGRSQWEPAEGKAVSQVNMRRRQVSKEEWKERVQFKANIGAVWMRRTRRNRANSIGLRQGERERTFRRYGA